MRTMRAMPENTTAHSRAYWNLTPTRVAVVMVPGPMNALVIIAAGPIFFSFCIKVFFSIRVYLLSELQITFLVKCLLAQDLRPSRTVYADLHL